MMPRNIPNTPVKRVTHHRLHVTCIMMLFACASLAGCASNGQKRSATTVDRTPAQSRLKYELALQHFNGGRTNEAIQTINEAKLPAQAL